MRSTRRLLAITGAAVVLLAAATRLQAEQAASALRADTALMDPSRLGAPALFRTSYRLADSAVAAVEASDGDAIRTIGLATLIGREILLIPSDRSIGGFHASDSPPARFADALGTRRTEAYKAYLQAIGLRIFATPLAVLEAAPDATLQLRYGDRELPARVLSVEADAGLAILVVQFDDLSEEEDDEDDEHPPTPPPVDIAVTPHTFLVLRGAVAERPRTRGFEMVLARREANDGVSAITEDITGADLGGPVVVGFENGAEPGLVGMIGSTSDERRRARVVRVSDLVSAASRAAEADADLTRRTPVVGVTGHSAVLDRLGDAAIDGPDGYVIDDVVDGAGGDAAGLRPGDLVTGIDGDPVTGSTDFILAIREHEIGEQVVLTVVRRGAGTRQRSVRLEAPSP